MTTLRADPAEVGIEQWRALLVRRILRILLIAGAVIAGPSVVISLITGQWGIAVVDVVALSTLAWLSLSRGVADRTRALGLIVTPFVVGASLLPIVPPAGQVYLLAVPVLAALLLGVRAALIALGANAVALLVAGIITGFDPMPVVAAGGATAAWAVISLNLLFIDGVMALSCAVLLQRLERSLDEEHAAREALAVRGRELEQANEELAREMAERERVEAHLRVADKLQALATLARGTAHDFNNVLGSILAVAEQTRGRTDEPQTVADMSAIVGACDRARDVVQQLVSFGGSAEAGRHPALVQEVVQTALPLLRAATPAGVTVTAELRADGWVSTRPSELEQVLTNLVRNASQALAGHADPTITISVMDAHPATDAGSGGAVLLSVSDNGPGIPADDRHRIFDPFFTTKPVGEGSGLGLASVHGIVTSLGGRVDVVTEVGRGTTFHVLLPTTTDRPSAEPAPVDGSLPTTPAPADRGVIRILLVDDEDMIRTMAARALTGMGHDVVSAADGTEAAHRFADDPAAFDLVITDMAMPGMDGAALIAAIRSVRPDLPVIVCSGHDAEAMEKLSAVCSLAKPYTIAELAGCVGRAVGRTTG